HLGTIHDEGGPRLAGERRLQGPERGRHEPEHRYGNVPWRLGAPGPGLDGGRQLVEGDIVGAADLEDLPPSPLVGDDTVDEGSDIADRDEVDRVFPATEDEGPTAPPRRLLEDADPEL